MDEQSDDEIKKSLPVWEAHEYGFVKSLLRHHNLMSSPRVRQRIIDLAILAPHIMSLSKLAYERSLEVESCSFLIWLYANVKFPSDENEQAALAEDWLLKRTIQSLLVNALPFDQVFSWLEIERQSQVFFNHIYRCLCGGQKQSDDRLTDDYRRLWLELEDECIVNMIDRLHLFTDKKVIKHYDDLAYIGQLYKKGGEEWALDLYYRYYELKFDLYVYLYHLPNTLPIECQGLLLKAIECAVILQGADSNKTIGVNQKILLIKRLHDDINNFFNNLKK